MSIFGRVAELEKKNKALEDMVVSLAQTVAELCDKEEEQNKKLDSIPAYVEGLFNETAQRMNKELSDGINQVLNFTPYGVK